MHTQEIFDIVEKELDRKDIKMKGGKKKMNKKILLFIVLPIVVASLVAAGLLTYYGQIQQNVNVEQAVILSSLDGSTITENAFTESYEDIVITNGDTLLSSVYSVKNIADTPRDVRLVTSCSELEDDDEVPGCDDEITTSYVGVLELTKKNPDWIYDETDEKIKITYTIVGDTFEYTVIGGAIPEEYELVYAMDKDDRFNPGNYATVKTVTEINSEEEGLPMTGDWNTIAEPGYCDMENTFDDFEHCRGAKLWIIPTSVIGDNGVLSWASMWEYYYETDLIVYSNTDTITLPAGGGFDFMVENTFVGTGNYHITTSVKPVTA